VKLTRKVRIWGKPVEVEVFQRSSTVWIAIGQVGGERLEVEDCTESAVLERWQDAARYRSG
jgi:hypothetical protein